MKAPEEIGGRDGGPTTNGGPHAGADIPKLSGDIRSFIPKLGLRN